MVDDLSSAICQKMTAYSKLGVVLLLTKELSLDGINYNDLQ